MAVSIVGSAVRRGRQRISGLDQPAALLLFPDNDAPQHPLLVDAQRLAARAYDTLKANGTIQRTVVIVDKAGMVRYYQRGLPSTDELLHAIKTF